MVTHTRDHHYTLSTTEHSRSSSRDLGASLPLSPHLYPLLQAPPVQDSTVLSHTPLLDVRPHGRNQDKPVCYCIASCINIWDEEHAASSLVGSGPPSQGTDTEELMMGNMKHSNLQARIDVLKHSKFLLISSENIWLFHILLAV